MYTGVVVIWVLCGILTAFIASSKNLNVALWAILGIALGFIAVLVILFVPSGEPAKALATPSPQWPVTQPTQSTTPATHEHQWVDSMAAHDAGSTSWFDREALKTRRCTVCGLIEPKPPEQHDHTWGAPLPSQKFAGRLYQECAGCKEARYIN